ncbi:MAG: Calx-beta domain-containing protein, partial [Oricola sp.]
FTFTVTRSGDTSAAGSVDYAVSGDVDGADFMDGVLPSGTIEFAAGASSQTLLLLVHGDTAIESDEVFTVTLSNASAGSAITTASAQGTILNDDVTPPPGTFFSITALDAAKAEGDDGTTIFTFTVTREGDLSAPGSVEYRTTGGPSPTANAFDFLDDTLARGVLEFSAGEASRIVSVAVTGDDAFEGDENFFVHIENASAGSEITTASAAGVILNDDTTPTTIAIAAADSVKAEGDGGSTPFTFTVTRSGDVSESDSVDYAVTGAQADVVDFVGSLLPAGTVTFNAGETSKTITIDVAGDSEVENDEDFSVVLLNPVGGAVITTGSAEGTILNDDAPTPGSFSIAARDTSRAEGDEGESTPFAFEITRTSDTAEAGSVYFEVTSSQADGSDFSNGVLHSGWINFPAGENFNVVTLGIWVAGDNIAEADETFTVTLSNPSAGFEIATASASATILNDDAAPPATLYEIAALDASKAEGDDGVTLFTFTISRSGDLTNPASIGYSLAGHGANPANSGDFASGLFVLSTATFAAGESSTTVSIRVAGDVNYEADEGFIVTIFDPSHGGAVVSGGDSATGTIANDDPVPITGSFSIAADEAVKAEGDSGITGLTFVVTRSGDSAAPASIDYAMTGGGADAGDFAASLLPADTVSFAAGETSKTITVAVRGDVLVENDESFVITLSNPSPGSDITTATAVGTILNDDAPPPITYAISPLDAVKAEGDDDTTAFTFTVTRSDNISVFSSITYIVRGETADSADFPGFVLAQGTVNFAIGETSKTVSVNVDGDLSIEDDETFTVSLIDSGLEGVVIATESAQGTILNDDFVPASTLYSITAVDAVKAEGDSGATDFTFLISRTGDTSGGGAVNYRVRGDDIDVDDFGTSYLPGAGFNFLAGETSRLITIQVAGDSDIEGNEDFVVLLSTPSPDSGIEVGSASGTILDDDAPPSSFLAIAVADAVKAEGDAGSTAFTFTVTRSGDTSGPGSVDYSLSGAADAADFAGGVLPGGTVIFAAGETSKTITVAVAGDAAFEGDEGFTVTLSNPSAGASIAIAGADGIIVNDDAAPPAPLVLLAADFDSPGDTEGFVYRDGAFGGLTSQRYASGGWDDDALSVSLGGINSNFARDISGGWETSFSLDEEGEVTLSFLYDLNTGNDYETNEYTQVLVSIDGGTPILVDQLTGDGNGGPVIATGPQSFSALLGTLSAGSHSLVIGGYNNQKTWYLEQSSLVIDDVLVTVAPDGEATP